MDLMTIAVEKRGKMRHILKQRTQVFMVNAFYTFSSEAKCFAAMDAMSLWNTHIFTNECVQAFFSFEFSNLIYMLMLSGHRSIFA